MSRSRSLLVLAVLSLGVAALRGTLLDWWAGPQITTVRVVRGPLRSCIVEQGQTRAAQTHLVSMPFEGRVRPIALGEGDTVEAGQVVAELVTDEMQLQFAEAEAAVKGLQAAVREAADAGVEQKLLDLARSHAKAMGELTSLARKQVEGARHRVELADATLKRTRDLRPQSVGAERDVEQAEQQRTEASLGYDQSYYLWRGMEAWRTAAGFAPAALEQWIERRKWSAARLEQEQVAAEARRDQLRLRHARTALRSPARAVVMRRHVSDERVLPPGAPLLELGVLEPLEVEADVLSHEALRLTRGCAAEVTCPGLDTPAWPGVVERIHPAGFTKLSALGMEQQRVRVIVRLAENPRRAADTPRLGAGYRVQVRLTVATRTDALLLPRGAVVRDGDGGASVFVVRNGQARRQAIEVGVRGEETVEVVSGVEEGEIVVQAPEANLRDGMRVRP